MDILIEEEYEEDGIEYVVGHTKRYQKVEVRAKGLQANEIIPVKLVGRLKSGMLFGEKIK